MKLKRLRAAHQIFLHTEGLFYKNAVITCGFAIPFIVVASSTVKSGLAMSISMYFAVIPAMVILSLIGTKLPAWVRGMVGQMVSLLCLLFISNLLVRNISPEIFDSLGIYITIMAVNGIMINRSEQYAIHNKWYKAMGSGFLYSSGFALVAMLVSALRELLGAGTLWGITVSQFKLPAASLIFSGFIVLAFVAAIAGSLKRMMKEYILRKENPTPEQLHKRELEKMVD